MFRFDFSSREYEYFLEKCPFTDEEIEILQMRRKGKSVVEISLKLCLCERTINNRIKSINNKIKKEIH